MATEEKPKLKVSDTTTLIHGFTGEKCQSFVIPSQQLPHVLYGACAQRGEECSVLALKAKRL